MIWPQKHVACKEYIPNHLMWFPLASDLEGADDIDAMNLLGYPFISSALKTLTHSSCTHFPVEQCVDALSDKMVTTEEFCVLLEWAPLFPSWIPR